MFMFNEWDQEKGKPFGSGGRLAIGVVSALLALGPTQARGESSGEEGLKPELSAMGKRGEAVTRARELILDILQSENGCTGWFQEVNPDPAGIFQSLHYELENGPIYVSSMADGKGEPRYKHPWAARTTQEGGRNSVIRLNAHGPFFMGASPLLYLDTAGHFVGFGESRRLSVGSYSGNTAEAQITILLHELGHILGRLPNDDDSWDGRSSQNTAAVFGHCKQEIRIAERERARRR